MAGEILNKYTANIESLTLLPASGGRFEVMLDDALIFSKRTLGRHAEPGEVIRLLGEKING